MYVICDRWNIVRHYSEDIRYIKTQTNGVTVGCPPAQAEAIYCNATDTYWPIKETYAGQPTYILYDVETVPEGVEVDITRYNLGELEIDPDLKAEADAKAEAESKAARVSSQATYVAKLYAEQQTDEATMLMLADLYDEWQAGIAYAVGKIISYGKDPLGDPQLYKVAQAHTSQADWTPDTSPALYTPFGLTPEGYAKWRQPTGKHDAYDIGDIVDYNGELYICTQGDGAGKNTWPPDVFGWEPYTPEDPEPEEPDPEPEPEPEPEPSDAPAWEDMEDGAPLKVGDHFTYAGVEYEVLRDMTKTPGWEPPALLGDFYKEAEA